MAVTLNKANLVLKDANGNIGKIEQLSNRDLAKIKTAMSDVALVVNQSNHKPIVATSTTLGVVKPDNNTIKIDSNGVLTATKATQDSAGQQINTTYVKGVTASNATITVTKGDGKTSTATINNVANATKATQDANGNNIVNTYATKSSLSSAQATLQNNINLVIQRIDKHEGSSAGSANARYCEKDMTDYFNTGALSKDIANNNFSELSVGNFITKNVVVNGNTYFNVKFYLAHFDYYYNFGDKATTKHHVLILPATVLGTVVMNDANTTEGGYLNSKMRKAILPLYSVGYQAAFGSAHILGWRNLVTSDVDKTVSSSGFGADLGASKLWTWADAVCELMSESMVYGAPVWSSSGFDTGSLNQQLALFRFNTSAILADGSWYWLLNVRSSVHFCSCSGYGDAAAGSASGVGGVRPFALLI